MDVRRLVDEALAGDEQAFAVLLARHRDTAFRAASRILDSAPDAHDAIQEACLVAWQRLDSLRDRDRFGAWFHRIATNVALQHRRQRVSRHKASGEYRVSAGAEGESWVEACVPLLETARGALTADERLLVNLHYFTGMSIRDISTLLAVPAGTVKGRLYRARHTLRREITKMTRKSTEHHAARTNGLDGFRPTSYAGVWQPLFTGDLTGWDVLDPSPAGWRFRPVEPGETPSGIEVREDGLTLDGAEPTVIRTGSVEWRSMELSMLVTPISGEQQGINFRYDDTAGQWGGPWYVFLMHPSDHTVAIIRNVRGAATWLSVVHHPIEYGREYAVTIVAVENSITSYIDGVLVNQVTDFGCLRGRVGLGAEGGKALYRDMRYRVRTLLPRVPADYAEQWAEESQYPVEHRLDSHVSDSHFEF